MRKTVGFIVGFILITLLGFTQTHPAFLLIGDWLGPLLGPNIYTTLGLLYLLLSDPLQFPMIFIGLLLTAFCVGLVIRRRAGASLTVLLLWVVLIPLLVISVFGLSYEISQMNFEYIDPMTVIPLPPSEMKLADLLEAPLLGKIAKQLIEYYEEDYYYDFGFDFLINIIFSFIPGIIAKPFIMIIGSLIGVEVGKRLERNYGERVKFTLIERLQSSSMKNRNIRSLKALIHLVIIVTAASSPLIRTNAQTGQDIYIENIFGVAIENREALAGYLMADTEIGTYGFLAGDNVLDDLFFAGVLSHDIDFSQLASDFPYPEVIDLLPFLRVVPDTLLVFAYIETPIGFAVSESEYLTPYYEQLYETELEHIIGFRVQIESESQSEIFHVTIVIQISETSLTDLSSRFGDILPHQEGFSSNIQDSISDGYFLPRTNSQSSSGAVLFSGYLDITRLDRYLPWEQVSPIIEAFVRDLVVPVELDIGGAYWRDFIQDGDRQFNLGGLLKLGSHSYSPDAYMSNIIIAATNFTSPQAKITTSLPQESLIIQIAGSMLTDFGDIEIISGPPSHSSHSIDIDDSMFIKDLEITKTVNQEKTTTGDNLDITVTIENKGSTSLSNVFLDDGNASKGYVNGLKVGSGDLEMNMISLPAGSSRELSYDLTVENPGQYHLSPAMASYEMDGNKVVFASNRPFFIAERPEYLGHLSNLRGSTVLILDYVSNGNGGLTLTLLDLLLVVLLVYHGYRGYMDFFKGTLIADPL